MENVIRGVFYSVTEKRAKENTEDKIIKEIESIRTRLYTAASHFDNESDPDLVEAIIYEMKSLTARYRYLLREAKNAGITRDVLNTVEHSERI